jgi:hypothetical protein
MAPMRRLQMPQPGHHPRQLPLPSIQDLSNKLHRCKYFSCTDLVKGYHKIPMARQDIAKTTLITPFGLFKDLFMPFGPCNAAQTFQRFMDRLFKHLPFEFTYLDDHIIASRTLEEHHDHLRLFFTILQENGLRINPACKVCVYSFSCGVPGSSRRPAWCPPSTATHPGH